MKVGAGTVTGASGLPDGLAFLDQVPLLDIEPTKVGIPGNPTILMFDPYVLAVTGLLGDDVCNHPVKTSQDHVTSIGVEVQAFMGSIAALCVKNSPVGEFSLAWFS